MPSLVTARSTEIASTSTSARSFSRVNSLKRTWDDEEGDNRPSSSQGNGVADWPSSPDRVRRKAVPPPVVPNIPGETAQDRRRKAILEAMSQNTPPPPSLPPTLVQAPSRGFRADKPLHSLHTGLQGPQELPSIPSGSMNVLSRKRLLPWNEDIGDTRKANQRSDSVTSESKRSTSSGSSAPRMNIQQKITLSDEQKKVLTLVVQEGKNIFFTGSAGTGKSVLLREIIKSLRKKYAMAADAVAVTASTGIAACNIGGVTLHSFGGVGLGIEKPEVLVQKVKKNKKAAARWLRTKVLIVDEVSMVDGELFDKFCKIGQLIRKNGKPWGGIQIIVTGDFFQLPPVVKGGGQPKFCFEAELWKETINLSVNLTKVFRQKDQRFIDMLNEMRFGKLSATSIASFKALARPIFYDDGLEPTALFPRREDVDRANKTRLDALNTEGWSYTSNDGGSLTDPVQREKVLSNMMASQLIELKVDAQVMLIKNVDETLVNGSMGKVMGFCHKALYIVAADGKWKGEDAAFQGLDEEETEKRQKVAEMLRSKTASGGSKPFPVVRFKVPGGGNRDMLVEQDSFKNELPNGEIQVSRNQLPLILAWAMSIHKSQGQTLERVKVDLGKVFEKGQAYVALSRATSLEGLQVLGFSAEKVMAHRKVAIWSENLRDLNV